MQTDDLLQTLGYTDSPRFLRPAAFGSAPEFAHVFERAARQWNVRGVYLLRRDSSDENATSTPVVYVAEAESERAADAIHHAVWNQNVVPFLLVRLPGGVRLYSGFSWERGEERVQSEQRGVLEALVGFNDVLRRLGDLQAARIDDGSVWQSRADAMRRASRVDERLLGHLRALGQKLTEAQQLKRHVAHALIGKFVYLRYLRAREILSDRRLADWGLDGTVLGRGARPSDIKALVGHVDNWLNGSIFPFPFTGEDAPTKTQIEEVASVFLGDNPTTGQRHLPFEAYDFSSIPVETLSVVYEQFLAVEGTNKEKGAYYTPIPLVNFMLAELDDLRELAPGMKVLDPSCGSGAFLVQCYRRLIARHRRDGGDLRPTTLRDLLTKSIYGVDSDLDACRVAALSLTLAMLDYLTPPDLQSTPQFKLPDLLGQNVFHGDFFQADPPWTASGRRRFDWIVGNPPWVKAGDDDAGRQWIDAHAATAPVTKRDVAEAFAWKAIDHLAEDGTVGLLLPAMTLVKDDDAFRRRFFDAVSIKGVANFSNLRRDLFGGRAETPTAAIFFRSRPDEDDGRVLVFSPMAANQSAVRSAPGERLRPWTITLNASEVRSVSRNEIRTGAALPWKLAMWGSLRDARLIETVSHFPSFEDFARRHELIVSQGLQLRTQDAGEPVEPLPEVVGKLWLEPSALKDRGRLYVLPEDALSRIGPDLGFYRKRGGPRPLLVSRPPHVIVSGGRTFAAYSDEFVVFPDRQIGIAGAPSRSALLKAVSLFLNSELAAYCEFLLSPEGGIRGGRSTLETLKRLPTPLEQLEGAQLREWVALHDELVATQRRQWVGKADGDTLMPLEARLNALVANLFDLTEEQRVLVHDLVHVRMPMIDGQVPDLSVGEPEAEELEAYARRLETELDAFVEGEPLRHAVTVLNGGPWGAVEVRLETRLSKRRSRVRTASPEVSREMTRLTKGRDALDPQWIYFDRNVFLYLEDRTVILKPLQRLWWTESQALYDADEIFAAAAAPFGEGA
ncbi:N-6 DNA methylase [Myxococcus sp. CA051A]|uniref:HsdM family class I SAM-dependent methyltransferase n=1 Tax=Myxococcus sp. CA051A TaxID=2741739 RepID=UPI00157A509A|nr:N-6 DNA methylase [Myxococcus sp. CA051A]NTX62662.1 N-6 DNA methylase [Myxococcus sp. CA051A]